jgi:hypothetical protein
MNSDMSTQPIKPQWIAKMYAGKVGRDHLGLGSVSSDQILPSLSPSINVLTFHPRYHSFYVFLLDEFWRRDRPRSRQSFIEFYRPREFVFSIGAHLCDRPEHKQVSHIVGGQKASPLASQKREKYFTKTHYIDSELGGYGLYYRSVMAELGIIYPGGLGFQLPIDVPSEYGKGVAESFRKAVKDTQYYNEFFDKDECDVPLEVIQEYIRNACLCQLQKSNAPDRPYLLDTFLHHGAKPSAESRKSTFCLFLDIANQTVGEPLNEDLFRQLIYFKKTDNGITYSPIDSVDSIYKKWRLYQTREYYAFALNALWYYLCNWGIRQGGDIQPIPVADFYQHLSEEVDFNKFAQALGIPQPNINLTSGFRSLEEWLLGLANANRDDFDKALGIDSIIHEHRIYQLAIKARSRPDVTSMVTGMIIMLALINLRFGNSELKIKPEWAISRMGSGGRLSVDGFLRTMDKRLRNGQMPIEEILRWICDDHVILQHQLVATSKLPENTFRFRREGNKLHFFNLANSLDFMNSRFEAISTTIHGLGFCGNLFQPDHELTPDGIKLLENGDL